MKKEIIIVVCYITVLCVLFALCTIARAMNLPWLETVEMVWYVAVLSVSILIIINCLRG
jgi:hypothetical protein